LDLGGTKGGLAGALTATASGLVGLDALGAGVPDFTGADFFAGETFGEGAAFFTGAAFADTTFFLAGAAFGVVTTFLAGLVAVFGDLVAGLAAFFAGADFAFFELAAMGLRFGMRVIKKISSSP
jgi:hypothetical protein